MEPLKDAQASETLVNARLRSRRKCATEIGDDYDEELPLIMIEELLFGPPGAPPARPVPDLTDPAEGDA